MKKFKFNKINIMVEKIGNNQYNVTGVFARRIKNARSDIPKHYDDIDSMHHALRVNAYRYYFSLLKNQV